MKNFNLFPSLVFVFFMAIGHKTSAQSLVPTGRLTNLTFATAQGQAYNWSQFPDFTAPNGKKVIFAGAGRVKSNLLDLTPSFTNLNIFNRGFTHVNYNQMVQYEQGNPSNWFTSFPKNRRTLFVNPSQTWIETGPATLAQNFWVQSTTKEDPFIDIYESNSNPNFQWAIRAIPGYKLPGGNLTFGNFPTGNVGLKSSFDVICYDVEITGQKLDNEIVPSIFYSGSLGLTGTDIPNRFRQATANRYAYLFSQTKSEAGSGTWLGGFDMGSPSLGTPTYLSDYSNPSYYSIWNIQANANADALAKNMPTNLNGKYVREYMDYVTPSVYFQNLSELTTPQFNDNSPNYMSTILGPQEIVIPISSLPRMPVYWLYTEKDSHKPVPNEVAEAIGIFPWFTGITGMFFWDDINVEVLNNRVYQCYEHYMHGLYRIFSNHKDMLEGSSIYLNQNTEFRVTNVINPANTLSSTLLNKWTSDPAIGGLTYKSNASILKTNKMPFVRAIVKGCDILVAATYPYVNANTQTTIQIKYPLNSNGSSYWSGTVTLSGNEVYLGRATMKPSLDIVTVDNNTNVSTPIFISPGTHNILVQSGTDNPTFSYAVVIPSNSPVTLTNYGTTCQFNTNGATGWFQIRMTATNPCSTNIRNLVFVVGSAYRIASNPVESGTMNIQFDEVSNLDGLPTSIELYDEKETNAVGSWKTKDFFDKKGFKNSNTLELDVKKLAKGVYYLHMIYETPQSILAIDKEAKQKARTERTRVILN